MKMKMVSRKQPKFGNTCTYKDASWLTKGWKIQQEAPSGASS